MTKKFDFKRMAQDAHGYKQGGGLNLKNLSVVGLQELLFQAEDDLAFAKEEGQNSEVSEIRREIEAIKAELRSRGAKEY